MKGIAIVLLLFGLVTAGLAIGGVGGTDRGDSVVEQQAEDGTTMPILGLLAGLSLSAGVVLFGIGMGRWRNPRTHTEPGDAIVDPEAHDKMKHV
jgi:hypothetical protein